LSAFLQFSFLNVFEVKKCGNAKFVCLYFQKLYIHGQMKGEYF